MDRLGCVRCMDKWLAGWRGLAYDKIIDFTFIQIRQRRVCSIKFTRHREEQWSSEGGVFVWVLRVYRSCTQSVGLVQFYCCCCAAIMHSMQLSQSSVMRTAAVATACNRIRQVSVESRYCIKFTASVVGLLLLLYPLPYTQGSTSILFVGFWWMQDQIQPP